MGLERRDRAVHGQHEVNPVGVHPAGEEPRVRPEPRVKSFEIDKRLVYGAWEKVRANGGAPGVDAVSIERFAVAEADNLYKLWNRMSSGSYFPGPVRAVEIPKDHGAGVRVLGVPNTVDRIAQTAAAMLLEVKLEPIFHRDSYGYRPGRGAHDALAVARRRCWGQDKEIGQRARTVAPGSIDGSLSRGWCRHRRCFPLHTPRSRTGPSPACRHNLRNEQTLQQDCETRETRGLLVRAAQAVRPRSRLTPECVGLPSNRSADTSTVSNAVSCRSGGNRNVPW